MKQHWNNDHLYYLQTPDSCRDIDRGKYKDFTFDHSYWSFDPNDENYASQEEVRVNFSHLGRKQTETENTIKIIRLKFPS